MWIEMLLVDFDPVFNTVNAWMVKPSQLGQNLFLDRIRPPAAPSPSTGAPQGSVFGPLPTYTRTGPGVLPECP